MPYAVLNDLLEAIDETELVGLTDDAATGEIDPGVVDRAIADAAAEIDGHVGKRYPVPFADPVPDRVRALAVTIAVYRLDTRRRSGQPERRKHYEDAVAFLKAAARGEATLGPVPADETPGRSAEPRIVSTPPTFGRENW